MSRPALPPVRYAVRLRVPAWGGRAAVVLDEACWHVRGLELDEGLDRPYGLELELVTEELELELDPLVGAELTLACRRDDSHGDERLIHGVVWQAWYLGTFGERLHLRLSVGPALSRLGLGRRSRVFQGKTVVQVVEAVAAEGLAPRGRTIDASRLLRSYDERDYCVQFRESDGDFVARILAEEGIGFWFEHGDEAETLVLFDDPRALRPIHLEEAEGDGGPGVDGGGPDAAGGSASGSVVAVSTSQADRAGTETIVSFEWRRQARPRRVEVSGWDWKAFEPERMRGVAGDDEGDADADAPWAFGERYEHGRRRTIEEHGSGPHLDHTPRAASDAHAGHVARSQAALGRGNVLAFAPGRTFELEGHPHQGLDRGYAITRVVHRADCPEADASDDGHLAGPNYDNRFECIPSQGVRWSPRPRPKPRVHGHLMATVVGPPGEEIHTDEHGRIKAWIHWDREHEAAPGEDASCWLRVAQTWAGPGFGALFIPRVGMEVLVSFADGDPDQPLCVGCVYDGRNRPPYPLPQERSKSTIKTRSTPRGQGGNELRFDDAAGHEEVYVHAQRDLLEVVRRDRQRRVGGREAVAVEGDRSVTVAGSQAVTIEGTHAITIKGTSPHGVPLPGPHCAIEVERELAVSATRSVRITAPESITLAVQGTMLTLTPQGLVLQSGQGASAAIDLGVVVRSAPGASLELDAAGGLALAAMAGAGVPGAALGLAAAATLASQAGAGLQLGHDVTLRAPPGVGAPGAALTLDAGATITGHAVALRAQAARMELDTGATVEGMVVRLSGAEVACEGTKTSISGQQVSTQALALLTMAAPLVKIN